MPNEKITIREVANILGLPLLDIKKFARSGSVPFLYAYKGQKSWRYSVIIPEWEKYLNGDIQVNFSIIKQKIEKQEQERKRNREIVENDKAFHKALRDAMEQREARGYRNE